MSHELHEQHEHLLYAEEVFAIQGAIFELNRLMGAGFLEAVRDLAPEHRAQVLNYLRATGMRLGLLVNFGSAPKARIERLVL